MLESMYAMHHLLQRLEVNKPTSLFHVRLCLLHVHYYIDDYYYYIVRMNLTVSMNTSKPVRAGDSVSIICGANIDRNLVDVPVDVDLHLASPEGMNETQSFANSSGRSLHQTSIHFSNISAEVSGIFICNVNITASSMNKYLIPAHVNQTIDLILGKLYPIL